MKINAKNQQKNTDLLCGFLIIGLLKAKSILALKSFELLTFAASLIRLLNIADKGFIQHGQFYTRTNSSQ